MTDAPDMPSSAHDRIGLGVALMAAAMLVIPVRDGLAKSLVAEMSVFAIAWGAYTAAAVIALPIALARHGVMAVWPPGLRSQAARTVFLVSSMTTFFFSLRSIPLADAISAFFIGPFIAAALAPVVLGEKVERRVYVAVIAGFSGVLLVVRPSATVDLNVVWALSAGALFAAYILATRRVATQTPPLATLSFQCLLGAVLLTPFALGDGLAAPSAYSGLFLSIGAVQVLSHVMSITAFRYAAANVLSPLVYLEIVGATAIGYLAFGDWPTPMTWLGIFIIVAAGALVAARRAPP
ncbi:MAG: EamA family transporter, partial [Pseudomonadota bacterium]